MGVSSTRHTDTDSRRPSQQSTQAMPSRASPSADPDETTDFVERVETTDCPDPAEETTDAPYDDTDYGAGDPGDRCVFMIGIGGPSCSGKSTLAKRLSAALNSPLNPVPLDGYFMPDRMPRHPEFGINWETPEGLDFETLLKDLHLIERTLSSTEAVPSSLVIKANPGSGGGDMIRSGMANRRLEPGAPVVIVVEGFLLFYDTAISQMFDCTLWVQADCSTCSTRRHRREGSGVPCAQFFGWYSGLVWSHFEKFQARQLANADGALRLDAEKLPADLQDEAVSYCKAKLQLK